MSANVVMMTRENGKFGKVEVIESGPRFDRRFQAVGTLNARKQSAAIRATFSEAVQDAIAIESNFRKQVDNAEIASMNAAIKSAELDESETCREMPEAIVRPFGQTQFVKNVWNLWNSAIEVGRIVE